MKTRRIWVVAIAAAALTLWIGLGIRADFHVIQLRYEIMGELKWTAYLDGEYQEVVPIQGSENYLCKTENDIFYTIVDGRGETLGDSYDSLTDLGGGVLQYQRTQTGSVLDEEKGSRRNRGYLNDQGQVLEEDDPAVKAALTRADGKAKAEEGLKPGGNGSGPLYTVKKGGPKERFVGIVDASGHWLLPPVFDRITLSEDGKKAVLFNVTAAGVAELEEIRKGVWR